MDKEILEVLQGIRAAIDSKPDYTMGTAAMTVFGVVATAWLTALYQLKNTKLLLGSEFNKVIEQLKLESSVRDREKKREVLRSAVEEFLVLTDPDLHQPGTPYDGLAIVRVIHRIQVLCDARDQLQCGIRDATTQVGLAVRNGGGDRIGILQGHGKLVDCCSKF